MEIPDNLNVTGNRRRFQKISFAFLLTIALATTSSALAGCTATATASNPGGNTAGSAEPANTGNNSAATQTNGGRVSLDTSTGIVTVDPGTGETTSNQPTGSIINGEKAAQYQEQVDLQNRLKKTSYTWTCTSSQANASVMTTYSATIDECTVAVHYTNLNPEGYKDGRVSIVINSQEIIGSLDTINDAALKTLVAETPPQ